MTGRAPFASVWSAHNRAAVRAERRTALLRYGALWGLFWACVALIALLWAASLIYASGAGLHGRTPL